MNADIPLFSYGTLQRRDVQLATYGRPLVGVPDVLIGYRLDVLPDRDRVAGAVFLLTAEELAATDRYEGSDYVRAELSLESGRRAFVYLDPEHP